jgi:hypothetical protein
MDVSKYGLHEFRPGGLIVGVDLGQANDFTAITVVERINECFEKAHDGKSPDVKVRHFQLRHAQRLPLGTSYPDVAEFVMQMVKELSVPMRDRMLTPALVVDGTGVGKPVVDMMRRAGLKPVAIAITGGREENSGGDFNHSVPKRNLVSSLIVAFQEGRLKLSAGIPAIKELEHELLNFKAKISATGHDTYDAWRESVHDDLVLATALAVWWGEKFSPARVFPLRI